METNGKKFSTYFNNFHKPLINNILGFSINNDGYIIYFQFITEISWIKMDNITLYLEQHWK